VFNRYGLVESVDVRVREAERRWQESGADHDKTRYINALRHAGRGREADDLYMQPHVERYERTESAADHVHSAPGPLGERLRREAREAREEAAKNLHDHATDLGRVGGEFLRRRNNEALRDHALRLATLAGSNSFGTRWFDDGRVQYNFWHGRDHAHQAEHLNRALAHHYPHWESKAHDWAQGDRVISKGAVSFRPTADWTS